MSFYGELGAIMAHFGWKYKYIMWGIRWPILLRMLADQGDTGSPEDSKEDLLRKYNEIKNG